MTNLARLITDSAAAGPERPAIRLDDAVVPYGGLDHATRRVAGLLAARGVGPGDRVGIMLPNVPYFPIALYGILRLGAVAAIGGVSARGGAPRRAGPFRTDTAPRCQVMERARMVSACQNRPAPRAARSRACSSPTTTPTSARC